MLYIHLIEATATKGLRRRRSRRGRIAAWACSCFAAGAWAAFLL